MVIQDVKADNTPARKSRITTPARLIRSPYFSSDTPVIPIMKRKTIDEVEKPSAARSAPREITSVKKEAQIVTSPYFSQPVPSHTEFEAQEEKKRERKRRRLTVRGDTPPEFIPSPPSSPHGLANAMRRIKPELVQEKVRDDPWKIVVATTLLNKTNGKVALPVYWKLLEIWPTPSALAEAAAPTLTRLLHSLGTQSLRTQRLIRMSNAYAMHPPKLPEHNETPKEDLRPFLTPGLSQPTSKLTSPTKTKRPRQYTRKEYKAIISSSPISHLPFAGPYAIDSFRIFSPSLSGGGAPAGVDRQLERIEKLSKNRKAERDDFDEAPEWYDPELLSVESGDEEWRNVRPDDKELRRYLVWRWAIEGVKYDPENDHSFGPANWLYLNHLIRK